jgi:hypothetical protein
VWFKIIIIIIIIIINVRLKPVFNFVVQFFFEQLTGIQEVKELLACKKPEFHN